MDRILNDLCDYFERNDSQFSGFELQSEIASVLDDKAYLIFEELYKADTLEAISLASRMNAMYKKESFEDLCKNHGYTYYHVRDTRDKATYQCNGKEISFSLATQHELGPTALNDLNTLFEEFKDCLKGENDKYFRKSLSDYYEYLIAISDQARAMADMCLNDCRMRTGDEWDEVKDCFEEE